jgi:hypothetical protein
VQDAVATVVDLANRGVLVLTDEINPQLAGSTHDVRITLEHLPERGALRRYEELLLNGLFGYDASPGQEVLLSTIRGRFEGIIPQLQDALHRAVADVGLFVRDPEVVRRRFRNLGWVLVGVGLFLAVVGAVAFSWAVGITWLPGSALALLGYVLTRLARAMPRRTPAGALEAARWRAFRAHLTSAESATHPEFLPYAVAFGVDRSFLQRVESVGTPPPSWYPQRAGYGWGPPGGIVVLPGGWSSSDGGTWSSPSASDSGGFGMPEAPSPQGWSDALAGMLNAASEAMAAGGGSGGWSGGGFGGGGGGGGGSGGFN